MSGRSVECCERRDRRTLSLRSREKNKRLPYRALRALCDCLRRTIRPGELRRALQRFADLTRVHQHCRDAAGAVCRASRALRSWSRSEPPHRMKTRTLTACRAALPESGPTTTTSGSFSSGSLVILTERNMQYRQIFTDDRPLLNDPNPTWNGYSTARWDGDTLVVQTNGFKDGLWLDAN